MEAGTSILLVRPRHHAPLPRTLAPLPLPRQIPHTSLLVLHPRFAVLHAVRTRNVGFDPWKFGGEDEDEDDSEESVPRRRRSRRPRQRRRWWSDNQVEGEQEGGILEQLVDGLWILQVFRSYGLFLPVILISLLLATGPKAFLLGSGVPFGLSLAVFAFKKLSEWINGSQTRKPKRRRKRRSRFTGKGDAYIEDEDSQAEEIQQGRRTKRKAYQTRAAQNDRVIYNDNPVSSFGGWEELVTEDKTESTQTQTPVTTKDRLEMITERKITRSLEERDLPLLLRLLIAVFPFLGSWTDWM